MGAGAPYLTEVVEIERRDEGVGSVVRMGGCVWR